MKITDNCIFILVAYCGVMAAIAVTLQLFFK